MKKRNRTFALAIVILLLAATASTAADSYPVDLYPRQPIRVIVPYAPGGGGDTMMRTVIPFWEESLPGARFVVENMGGAGTQIGMQELYNAGADPYVIGVISRPHTSLTIAV